LRRTAFRTLCIAALVRPAKPQKGLPESTTFLSFYFLIPHAAVLRTYSIIRGPLCKPPAGCFFAETRNRRATRRGAGHLNRGLFSKKGLQKGRILGMIKEVKLVRQN
jgi:hypothetical protein